MEEQIKMLKMILRALREESRHIDMVATYAEELEVTDPQFVRLAEAAADIDSAILHIEKYIKEATR